MIQPLLTVGIPTYNRREAVTRRVQELVSTPLPEDMEVLVIDNASSDGTFEDLEPLCRNSRVRLLQNDHNLGFAGNFVQLIRKCQSAYLLYNSDEDMPLLHNLVDLQDFLRCRSPLFVSPVYYTYRDGVPQIERGKDKIREMKPVEFWGNALISGLVFHAPSSRAILDDFETLRHIHPTAAEYYPQIILISKLLARGSCYWWHKPINEQRDLLQSQHRPDRLGFAYCHVSPRWQLHKDMVGFLHDMIETADDPAAEAAAAKMLHTWELMLFDFLRNGIREERPDLLAAFDAGARRSDVNSRWINRLGRWALHIGTEPIATFKKVKRRLLR